MPRGEEVVTLSYTLEAAHHDAGSDRILSLLPQVFRLTHGKSSNVHYFVVNPLA